MQYNSIPVSMINEVMNVEMSTSPKVGMCGTLFCGSDQWPMVVTEIISDSTVRVADMYDEDYECNKHKDENGVEWIPSGYMYKYVKVNDEQTNIVPIGDIYKKRKNGRWIKQGKGLWSTGAVHFGRANEYRDPDF